MDLVGDDEHAVRQADFSQAQKLLPRPHPPHRVVGIGENQKLILLPGSQPLKEGKVDGVSSIFIDKRAAHQRPPGIVRRAEKRRVGGR